MVYLLVGLNVLFVFGCTGFVSTSVGSILIVLNVGVGVPRVSVLLPIKVSFCAFRTVKCAVSMCEGDVGPRSGF